MIDFEPTGQLIVRRNCDCGKCSPSDTPHVMVVEPILRQLVSTEIVLNGGLFVTHDEAEMLAHTLHRQAQIMDYQEGLIDSFVTRQRIIYYGAAGAALWVLSTLVIAWLI